jgi:hypothetical protein
MIKAHKAYGYFDGPIGDLSINSHIGKTKIKIPGGT